MLREGFVHPYSLQIRPSGQAKHREDAVEQLAFSFLAIEPHSVRSRGHARINALWRNESSPVTT